MAELNQVWHSLAHDVEQRYNRDWPHPFPYEDCFRIQREHPAQAKDLIPDLDLYLSFIAGYSSGATTLDSRPHDELRAAIPQLEKSFFKEYPRYRVLAKFITAKDTPTLFRDLRLAKGLRRDLMFLMRRILS